MTPSIESRAVMHNWTIPCRSASISNALKNCNEGGKPQQTFEGLGGKGRTYYHEIERSFDTMSTQCAYVGDETLRFHRRLGIRMWAMQSRGRVTGAGLGVSSGSGVEADLDRGVYSDVGVSVRGLYDGSGLAVDAMLELGGSVTEVIDETLGSATEDSSSVVALAVGMAGSDLCAVECESAGVRAGACKWRTIK
jgi:hypothetical protein